MIEMGTWVLEALFYTVVPIFLASGTSFVKDSFSMDGGWRLLQDDSSALHLLCTFFYCYYISSTSDHQALSFRGWGLLPH